MTRKDFVYLAQLFKIVLKAVDHNSRQTATNIIVNGLRTEYSNFDEKKFLAYLKAD